MADVLVRKLYDPSVGLFRETWGTVEGLRWYWSTKIEDYEKYKEIARWDPIRDTFSLKLSDSIVLKKISELQLKALLFWTG